MTFGNPPAFTVAFIFGSISFDGNLTTGAGKAMKEDGRRHAPG
jgi:hypothetical protein